MDEDFQNIVKAENIRRATRDPHIVRDSVIHCLSGLIPLIREKYGSEYVQVMTELLAGLEDLNAGIKNPIFEPRSRGKSGRPPAPRHRTANLAMACALLNCNWPEDRTWKKTMTKNEWINKIVRKCDLKNRGQLTSFAKKITSKEPPSSQAKEIYEILLESFKSTDLSAEEILEKTSYAIIRPTIN